MNATEKYYTDEEYIEILNDIYGTVKVCGMTYDAGNLLQEIDPTAFRCGNNDYFDSTPRYECGECQAEFDNQDDAEECCKEDK
jgi:hypothetical protein